jgi:hypothetical protein
MAGKKPIPAHDVEMGGGSGGGVRGSTVRPLPKGSGTGRTVPGKGKWKTGKQERGPTSHEMAFVRHPAMEGRHPLNKSSARSKPSGSARSSAAKASLMTRLKAKAQKFADSRPQRGYGKDSAKIWKNAASEKRAYNSKDANASDAKIDFVHADGPAIPKFLSGMTTAMRRNVWARIPKAQRVNVWHSLVETQKTQGKSHAQGRQTIQTAIADLKSGKPANRFDAAPQGVSPGRAPGKRGGGIGGDKARKRSADRRLVRRIDEWIGRID